MNRQAEGSDLKIANSNCGYILNKKVWYIKDKIYVYNVYIHITSVHFQKNSINSKSPRNKVLILLY